MNTTAVVVGAGGHARVVIATLRAAGWEVAGVYDDDEALLGTPVLGAPVVGRIGSLPADVPAVIGVGANRVRAELAAANQARWVAARHPSSVVHDSVDVGAGTVMFAGSVIQPETRLGRHVVVNTAASVDHQCVLGDFSQVGPGARLAGGVHLGVGAMVGMGASVLPGITIGAWTTVGAGAVVTGPVADGATVTGVPARPPR